MDRGLLTTRMWNYFVKNGTLVDDVATRCWVFQSWFGRPRFADDPHGGEVLLSVEYVEWAKKGLTAKWVSPVASVMTSH